MGYEDEDEADTAELMEAGMGGSVVAGVVLPVVLVVVSEVSAGLRTRGSIVSAVVERLVEVTGRRRVKDAVVAPNWWRLGWKESIVAAVAEIWMYARHFCLFVALDSRSLRDMLAGMELPLELKKSSAW